MSYKSLRELKLAFWEEELKELKELKEEEVAAETCETLSNVLYLSGFEIIFEGNCVFFTDCRL